MDVRELRIGNLTYYGGRVYTIGYYPFSFSGHENDMAHYKPIPLTEEWLLKFGFENYDSLKFSINDLLVVDLHDFTFGVNRFDVCWLDNKNTIHVHQLQNLYFALTGKELEITS